MSAAVERHALEARRAEVETDVDRVAFARGTLDGAHPDLLEEPARQPARSWAGRSRREVRPGDVEGERLRRVHVLEAVEGDVAGGEAHALQAHDRGLSPAARAGAAPSRRPRPPRGTAPRSRRPGRSGASAGRTATARARPGDRAGPARAPAARAPAPAPSAARRCAAGGRWPTRGRRARGRARARPPRRARRRAPRAPRC